MKKFNLEKLPNKQDFETKEILKKLASSKFSLGKLNGMSAKIPNERILINNLTLAEAKDSSAIENIITTYDELYQEELKLFSSKETKEVVNYKKALLKGVDLVKKQKILIERDIKEIQEMIEPNKKGYAKIIRHLKNPSTGEIIYTPPETEKKIISFMANLEEYINNDSLQDLDPLIKMAIIHFQFEAIHPFLDGNGRTGRIINILYLIIKNQLNYPILYLSSYIIANLSNYYKFLQKIQQNNDWQDWVLYMLDAIEQTSLKTIELIDDIDKQMQYAKILIKEKLSNIYSKDLVDILFWHTYTKIDTVAEYLGITQKTASSYLNKLTDIGFLDRYKIGRNKFFINKELYKRFTKPLF